MTALIPPILLLAVGLALLYKGATLLIENSTRLAKNLGIPIIIVGFTIIAFGTSLPEMMIGILSGIAGENTITLGDVLGSNIANIGLALGLAALFSPIGLPSKNHRFELYSLVLAAALLYLLLRDGNLDRIDGIILVSFAAVFLFHIIRDAIRGKKVEQIVEKVVTVQRKKERLFNTLGIIAGLILLLIGATMTVNNAVDLARIIGVSELLIGLTLVAIGTSLPEIIATTVAAIKKVEHISIGSVIGSNIMNILLVLGITVLIHPIHVNDTVWQFDLPFLLLVSLLIVTITRTGRQISRREGIILLSLYTAYVLFAFLLRM